MRRTDAHRRVRKLAQQHSKIIDQQPFQLLAVVKCRYDVAPAERILLIIAVSPAPVAEPAASGTTASAYQRLAGTHPPTEISMPGPTQPYRCHNADKNLTLLQVGAVHAHGG